MDDVLVYGRTHDEHDRRLVEVLRTIEASGLKLKKEKCIFGQKELSFVGHRLTLTLTRFVLSEISAGLKTKPS